MSAPEVSASASGGGEPVDREESLTLRAFWILTAKSSALVFGIAVPLILVRKMTPSEFGLYKQIFLVVTTAYSVLPLGFAMSAFYFFPREPERRREVVWNIVLYHALTGLLAALVLLLWPGLLTHLFQDPELARYGPRMGVVVFLWCASLFVEFVALANGETRLAAALIAALHGIKAVVMLAAVMAFGTLDAVIDAAAAFGFLQLALVLAYLSWRFPGYYRRFDWPLMKGQLAYALPHGAAGLLWFVRSDFHRYFVGHHFDAAVFALYAVGTFQIPVLAVLRESVAAVMIPKVSELQRDGNTREILFLFARTMRKLAAFYLPVAALLILNAREIVVLLFTEQYVESVPLFAVNAALIPLVAIAIGADAVIRAYAEHRYYVIHVRAVLTVLLVAGLIFAVDRFGLMGVVLVVAGTETLERIVLAAKTGSILGMTRADLPLFKDVGKIGLATALGAAVTLPVHSALSWLGVFPILLLESAVFSSVYVAALFALGVVTREEVDALKSQMERARRRLPGRAETVPIAQVRAE
jgi:O-antigen/teichoic acid export membrane protein